MHDPCAVMALIHPEIFTFEDYYVQVETGGEYCRGATVADRRRVMDKAPNAKCIMNLNRDAFADYVFEGVRAYG